MNKRTEEAILRDGTVAEVEGEDAGSQTVEAAASLPAGAAGSR